MRKFVFAAIALLAAAPAARAQGGEERQKIDTSFAFAKGGSVDLGHVSGDIIVTGWTKGEIKIYAVIETGYLKASMSSSRVQISAHSRHNRMGKSHYELSVPIGTEVRATAVSGNIAVRGVGGEVSANTVSGDIEVRDAGDRVELHTVSGDVHASKLRGRIRGEAVSGDFTLDDISGEVKLNTVSGQAKVRGALSGAEFEAVSGDFDFAGDLTGSGTFNVNTHSGDVHVTLPQNISATFELQTFSGELRSGFPLTLQPGDQALNRRNRRMRFDVNGGGTRIRLGTFSGDLTLDKSAPRANKEN